MTTGTPRSPSFPDISRLLRPLFVLLFSFFATGFLQAKERPNVLMIIADDLNTTLGCYGHPEVKTPNIDRLAGAGTLFERAYCQQAVCNPSRASALTGRRPDRLGIWDLRQHFRRKFPDIVTLPQHFKNNGYFTQGIGKVFHNGHMGLAGDPESWSVPATWQMGGHFQDWVVPGEPFDTLPKKKGPPIQRVDVPDHAYWDGRIADDAVEVLNQRSAKDAPFFLAVGFWKPHLPFNAPKKYWDLYDRESVAPPANPDPPSGVPELALHNWKELRNYAGMPENGELTAAQVAELRHGYLAAVSFLDTQVGKVLDALDRNQLRDNTVIVFFSDHGFHLGEHSIWAKTSNFERDAGVPLIVSSPGQKQRGARTRSLAELLDLYPTLVELCGLPRREALDGVSLRPVLDDPEATVRQHALTQHPRPAYYRGHPEFMGYSLRTGRFRYTEWRQWKDGSVAARELYNHRNDPLETANLAGKSKYAATVKRLSQQLKSIAPTNRD